MSPPPTLQTLPLDIIHLILLQMSQRDIGRLRLVSRALTSKIGIQYMLRTFPMRLSFESIARVLALTENLALAKHVRILTFSVMCQEQLTPALSRVIDGYTAKHTAIVEALARKYVDSETATLCRDLLRERKASERTWPACPLRYASMDLGPVLGEKKLGFKPWFFNCADPALVVRVLYALVGRFPVLRRVYIEQFGWIYDWKLTGQLSLFEWESSLDRILPGPEPVTISAEDGDSSRAARSVMVSSRRMARAVATRLRGLTRRGSSRRQGARGLFDHLTFFILSDRSYTPFWPVAPKFDRLELTLPSFMSLASFNVPEGTDDNGISFRMCLGATRLNVRCISVEWIHVATEPGEPRVPVPTNVEKVGRLAGYVLRGILSLDMVKLEEVELKFPCGYSSMKDAANLQNGFLVPLKGTLGPPNLRRLDLSHFATTEEELNKTLGGAKRTLRNLKLTSVSMTEGSWIGWFRNVQNLLGRLKYAEFCGIFGERGGAFERNCVQMETPITRAQYLEGAFALYNSVEGMVVDRTLGSVLGEMCLSWTPSDSQLREVGLWLLEKEMRLWRSEISGRISYW